MKSGKSSEKDEKEARKTAAMEKDFQMKIDKDGQWFHEGGIIKRPALISLFSSVLSCDADGQHWLRTPVEFGKIEVEDAPFVIIKAEIKGFGQATEIRVSDNLGREYLLSKETPLIFKNSPMPPHAIQPYVQLEKGLSAKLSRPVYYQLAAHIAEQQDSLPEGQTGLWSMGSFFAFPIDEGDKA